MLQEFGQCLYIADGPTVSFYGFPYPTRMAVVQLSDGSAWVWSPVALSDELADSVETVGPVRFIVSPNKIHHLFLSEWAKRWPDARLYAPPGLAKRKPELKFDDELGEEADPAWATDLDQVIFHGSVAMEEGWLMRLDSLVGEHGSTPREWRASFFRRKLARAAREKVLSWNPERLVIAHGECAQTRASEIIADSLSWM